ncbi:MAG: CHAT domain-containing protein [Candidatus Latescibacterota bacterium]|nr:MAG: CHAT domain-containing protein [Candidatus Latescibacterota bacterium]
MQQRRAEIESVRLDGRHAEAERQARELLQETERKYGGSSAQAAEAIDLLVECVWYTKGSREDASVELARRAVRIKETLYGDNDPRVAHSLTNLGVLLDESGRSGAREPFMRALAIVEATLPADDPRVARVLTQYAIYARGREEHAVALNALERSLVILRQAPDTDSLKVAHLMNNLAISYWMMGDYRSARAHWERLLQLRRRLQGPKSAGVGSVLNNLAALHVETGDYEEALRLYQRSRDIRVAAFDDPAHPQIVRVTGNIAEMQFNLGRLDEARATYEDALDLAREVHGQEHPTVARALHGLGRVSQEAGDHESASSYLEQALTIREDTGPARRIARTLHYLATLDRATGNVGSAYSRCRRAAALRNEALGPAHPETAESLGLLATLLYERGDTAAAIEAARRSEQVASDHVRLASRSLAERRALLYAATRTRALDLLLQIAAQASDLDAESRRLVWGTLVRSRALVLDEIAQRNRAAAQSGDEQVAQLLLELQKASSRLASLTMRGAGRDATRHEEMLRTARQSRETAERRLAERCEPFRESLVRERTSLEDVAQHLPERSALLSYAVYERSARAPETSSAERPVESAPHYVAFLLISASRDPVVVPIGPVARIDSVVERWRTESVYGIVIANRTREEVAAAYLEAGAAARRAIWEPIESALEDVDRLFVVPDGMLSLVNFSALPLSAGRYLIDAARPIHYLAAERDLVPVSGTVAAGDGFVALGDPDFDLRLTSAAPAREDRARAAAAVRSPSSTRPPCTDLAGAAAFGALPGTRAEARAVAAIWQNTTSATTGAELLLGERATEAAFKSSVRGKRYLHVATHGFFFDGDCRVAGVANAGPATRSKSRRALVVASPLQLAGLALAGANNRERSASGEEDGILLAEEISAMNLQGIRWAVLSACDTGVGKVHVGEGVLGLRRSFQVAGARTLIMSLWPVSDDAAGAWMEALYHNHLAQGLGAADAVHQTTLQILNGRRARGEETHPFYWASFVAAGHWN